MSNPFIKVDQKKSTNFLVTYEFTLKDNSNTSDKEKIFRDTIYIVTDKVLKDGLSFLKFIKEEVAFRSFKSKDINKFKSFLVLWVKYDG